ncbi:hypothetical protein AMTRI_Chr13g84410 [Amborella trichopoda]
MGNELQEEDERHIGVGNEWQDEDERRVHRRPFPPREEEQDGEDLERLIKKNMIGHEREVAFCLMQKCMDVQSQGIKQQIKSVITLNHLTNHIYIKEAHVKEACKGMRQSNTKPMLVPIKEMTDVLSVESNLLSFRRIHGCV